MIFIDYAIWHYGVAPMGIFGLLRNYLLGTWHKFLIGIHARTLLAPWHRTKPSEVGTSQTFSDKILNGIIDFYIRIIAAIVRLFIIMTGLLTEAMLIVVFMALLIVWLLWPIILILLISKGLALL